MSQNEQHNNQAGKGSAARQRFPDTALPFGAKVKDYRIVAFLKISRQSQYYEAETEDRDKTVIIEEFFPSVAVGRRVGDPEVVCLRDQKIFDTAKQAFLSSDESRLSENADHAFVCSDSIESNNTVYKVWQTDKDVPVSDAAEMLADHPVYFRDKNGVPEMTINALPMPPMPAKRSYRKTPGKPIIPQKKKILLYALCAAVLAIGVGVFFCFFKPETPVTIDAVLAQPPVYAGMGYETEAFVDHVSILNEKGEDVTSDFAVSAAFASGEQTVRTAGEYDLVVTAQANAGVHRTYIFDGNKEQAGSGEKTYTVKISPKTVTLGNTEPKVPYIEDENGMRDAVRQAFGLKGVVKGDDVDIVLLDENGETDPLGRGHYVLRADIAGADIRNYVLKGHPVPVVMDIYSEVRLVAKNEKCFDPAVTYALGDLVSVVPAIPGEELPGDDYVPIDQKYYTLALKDGGASEVRSAGDYEILLSLTEEGRERYQIAAGGDAAVVTVAPVYLEKVSLKLADGQDPVYTGRDVRADLVLTGEADGREYRLDTDVMARDYGAYGNTGLIGADSYDVVIRSLTGDYVLPSGGETEDMVVTIRKKTVAVPAFANKKDASVYYDGTDWLEKIKTGAGDFGIVTDDEKCALTIERDPADAIRDAGKYRIRVALNDVKNYVLADGEDAAEVSFTVKKKNVSVSVNKDESLPAGYSEKKKTFSAVYSGEDLLPAVSDHILFDSDLVPAEEKSVTVIKDGQNVDSIRDVGTYTLKVGVTGANFAMDTAEYTFVIEKAPVRLAKMTLSSATYPAASSREKAEITEKLVFDNKNIEPLLYLQGVPVREVDFSELNAGTYEITVCLKDADRTNYALLDENGAEISEIKVPYTVEKRTLTVTMTSGSAMKYTGKDLSKDVEIKVLEDRGGNQKRIWDPESYSVTVLKDDKEDKLKETGKYKIKVELGKDGKKNYVLDRSSFEVTVYAVVQCDVNGALEITFKNDGYSAADLKEGFAEKINVHVRDMKKTADYDLSFAEKGRVTNCGKYSAKLVLKNEYYYFDEEQSKKDTDIDFEIKPQTVTVKWNRKGGKAWRTDETPAGKGKNGEPTHEFSRTFDPTEDAVYLSDEQDKKVDPGSYSVSAELQLDGESVGYNDLDGLYPGTYTLSVSLKNGNYVLEKSENEYLLTVNAPKEREPVASAAPDEALVTPFTLAEAVEVKEKDMYEWPLPADPAEDETGDDEEDEQESDEENGKKTHLGKAVWSWSGIWPKASLTSENEPEIYTKESSLAVHFTAGPLPEEYKFVLVLCPADGKTEPTELKLTGTPGSDMYDAYESETLQCADLQGLYQMQLRLCGEDGETVQVLESRPVYVSQKVQTDVTAVPVSEEGE